MNRRGCEVRRSFSASWAIGLLVFLASSLMPVGAEEAVRPTNATQIAIPQTAEEHLAMAKRYQQKVELYLQEVETHQQMLEAYKRTIPINPKAPTENPWLKKMRAHCERYIAEARQLASEAQAFADYHELRGRELQGQ